MVPGIFKENVNGSNLTNAVEFNNHPDTFLNNTSTSNKPWQSDSAGGVNDADSINLPFVTTQKLVDHEPIFSDNE